MGKVLQVLDYKSGLYVDFQNYRTAKARSEAKKILEEQTTDSYKFKEDGDE